METIELMDAQRAYTDALNEAERKNRLIAEAESRAFIAVQAIKSLGVNVTAREMCNVISAMQHLLSISGLGKSEAAEAAGDYLCDAHATLEDLAERNEQQ